MKSVISLLDSLVRSVHAPSQSSGPLHVLRWEKVFIRSEQWETEERSVTGFSVWAARKMERAAIFLAVFDPHSSFFALKPHGNAWYACFSSARRNGRFLSLPVAGSVSRNVATTGSGERRLYSAAGNSFFSAYETYSGLLQAFVVGMAQKDVIRKNSKISLLNYFSSPFDFGPHSTI